MDPCRLEVWSDYLCPWCFNASVRLRALEQELDGRLEITWRSFLLRPHPRGGAPGFPAAGDPPRAADPDALERFRAYTRSWERPAAEPGGGRFRVWQGAAGPPTHSVPPHVAVRAAATLGEAARRALHDRLMEAYFHESRDPSDRATLRALWEESGLPDEAFVRCDDPAHLEAVLDEHAAALERGVSGVPCTRMERNDALVVGAQPLAVYRRWVQRRLDGEI